MVKKTGFFNKILNFNKLELPNTTKSIQGYSYRGIAAPTNSYITKGSPVWRNLSSKAYLLECYETNPVVNAVVNIKAEAFANMRFFVKDLKDGEIIPLKDYTADKGKLNSLISQPNPLQSTYEWLRQLKVNYEVFGNSYNYASIPVGYENSFDYKDINVINNLQPYCVNPILTGKWLEATNKNEIIEAYEFMGLNGKLYKLPTNTVFHMNNTNIRLDNCFTEGVSDLVALLRPISNIDGAYESRNVLIRKRGALGLLSSHKKEDGLGSVALTDGEIDEIQESYRKYGLMDDQYNMVISPYPLEFTKMAMSVKELMLFEEIEADAIAISNAKGVPELLAKYYIKGGTFENLNASEKRLYDSTIIPEAQDFMIGFNNFLKLHEHGIELIGSYDHVNVLQSDQKQEAEIYKYNVDASDKLFRMGAVNYNYVLNSLGLENDVKIGEKYIWELDENQLQAIGVNNVNQKDNERE